MFRVGIVLLIAALQVTTGFAGEPDHVYLRSGEHLTGSGQGLQNGFLLWETSTGEVLQIPIEAIDRVVYPALVPPIVPPPPADPPAKVVDPAPVAPTPEAATDEPGEPAVEEAPAEPQVSMITIVFEQLERPVEPIRNGITSWTKRVEIGGRFIDGNSQQDTINFGAEFERQFDRKFFQFDFGGQYGRDKEGPITNRWFGNGTADFDRNGNWILFVTAKNEYDEFKNLDYRGIYSGGLGYRFYNEKTKRLIVRLGPGMTYERYFEPFRERVSPDLFGEVELRWPICEHIQLEHKMTINPTVEDFKIFRMVNNTGLLFRVDEDGRWNLKLGLRHEYNSNPNEGRMHSDYISSLVLVYTRK